MAAFRNQFARDVRIPIVNPPASAPAAYPISGLTFLLVPQNGTDTAKREATQNFIEYVVSTGQSIADGLHYAALPNAITNIDKTLLAELQANGKTLAGVY